MKMVSEDVAITGDAGADREGRLRDYAGILRHFRELRSTRAVSQSALSRVSGVAQGEISKIERGLVNPTVATLRRLEDALNQLLVENQSVSSSRATSLRPARPLGQALPFLDPNLAWERFEEFCRDFILRLPGVKRVNSYGRKGSKQKGIDFRASMESDAVWVFQCKQVREFSATQFRKAIDKDRYEAAKHVLLLACQAGVPVRDIEAANPQWEVWDAFDISRMVRQLSPPHQRALVSAHFGPYVEEEFLGVRGSAAFRTWSEHFEPYLREGRLFHHRVPLVGRDDVIASLHRFIADAKARVVVLRGRGGIGKSKVLHAFGEEHLTTHRDRHLLFADEGTPFSADTLMDIPAEPTTLVVDDAHHREDLGQLLSHVARWPHPAKVILAIRPEGRDRISALLAKSAIDASEVIWLEEVPELRVARGKELAVRALGPEFSAFADRLYAATSDCPLVTVVGAELLRQRKVAPELLERNDAFRQEVLGRFIHAALGQLGERIDRELAVRVMALLSALQPLRPTDEGLVESMAKFLETKQDDLIRMLDMLSETGILTRRGYQLRIVPDVLADNLLHRACLTSTGESTGYVDRLRKSFQAVAFDKLLANIAELDWRVQTTSGSKTTLLDDIWALFESEFRLASNSGQVALLRMVMKAAVYQPQRVLDLLEWSLEHPSDMPDQSDSASLFATSRKDVLHLLAELADRCAHGGHLARAADLLWRLGRDDARPTNQYPNHPMRLLVELAGYDLGKPVQVNESVLETVIGWLNDADVHDHLHSPLDVLDALLTKNVLNHSTDGLSVTLRPISVNPAATSTLRARVLRIVDELLMKGNAKVASRAVETLAEALHEPVPYLGLHITTEEKAAWEDEQLAALTVLRKAMARNDMPLLQLSVAEALAWTAGYSYSQRLRKVARDILNQLPVTFEVRVMDAITRPWGRQFDIQPNVDIEESERRRTERMQRTADELAAAKPSASELLYFLATCVANCEAAGTKVDAGYLVGLVAEHKPTLGLNAAIEIAAIPHHPLEFLLPQFLLGARRADPVSAIETAAAAVRGGSRQAAIGVAYLYAYRVWKDQLQPGDLDVLLALLQFSDPDVRAMAITGLLAMPDLHVAEKTRLILAAEVGESDRIGAALAAALTSGKPDLLDEMTDADLAVLVEKFEFVQDLEDYQVRLFLRRMAQRVPIAVLHLLIRRLDSLQGRGGLTAFRPIPHNWSGEPIWAGVSDSDRQRLLRAVRDLPIVEGWPRRVGLPDLYADLADEKWELASAILDEWIQAGDETKLQSAVRLFGRAKADFVFENLELVERTLNAAAKFGDRTSEVARIAFASSARSGTKVGRILEASTQDSQLFESAQKTALRYREGSPTWTFFNNLAIDTKAMVDHIVKIDEEMIAGPLP
jgi:transcriptional regulator with XRE-family HTH domain